MRKVILIIFNFLLYQGAFSQSNKLFNGNSPKLIKYLDVSFELGPIIENGSASSAELKKNTNYIGVDARLGFQKGSESIYAKLYRFPVYGIGVYASSFQNEVVGNPNAVYFFMDIPFSYPSDKRWKFGYYFSYGLSFNFNPYDPIDNPTNLFIGSYRNAFINLGFRASRELNERMELYTGIGFRHFSNGALSLPNTGINLLPFTFGANYRLTKNHDKVFSDRSIPKQDKRTLLNFHLAPGTKQYFIGDDNNFKLGIGVHILREISYKHRLGLGLEQFYSANSKERMDEPMTSRFWDSNAFALFGSWEWVLTKNLFAPMGLGVYLHRNKHNGEWNWYYQRVGMGYRFSNGIFTSLSIKAHKGKADFFEWTLGYTIFK
ncbi:hypothetical protein [Shivajiella indica]|uniref:Acyloxyacyl hydrolase n=1 Tax=Shivajiella indica TaxID=872115 RepID=A0ABW5BD59_9BACT